MVERWKAKGSMIVDKAHKSQPPILAFIPHSLSFTQLLQSWSNKVKNWKMINEVTLIIKGKVIRLEFQSSHKPYFTLHSLYTQHTKHINNTTRTLDKTQSQRTSKV